MELAQLSKSVDKQLAPLRRELEKAERKAGTETARLLRDARQRLEQIEIKGQSDWNQFLRKSRGELSKAIEGLESSVRPKRKTARKKATPKKS